ncbi:hypothetical protein LC607_00125 [Nostoc sp. CHAB 5824]|nr:hypothetical protein [Nostoc sp. CHAB 5824]
MEIIPKNAIELLPFTPEAIISICEESDLNKYLTCLFNKNAIIINPNGEEMAINYSSYGSYRLKIGIEYFQSLAQEFQEKAQKMMPAPAARKYAEDVPNFFEHDVNFGQMAKCAIAWDGTVSEVLSEEAFFSLTHLLEAQSDLECSILLCSNLFYRQALQVLRNYVEGMVIQLFFCENINDFEKWKLGQFHLPSIRGNNGILKQLSTMGFLPNELASKASDLYGDLNGSIHGAENKLINRGLFEGKWAGLIFQYFRFQEWCEYYTRCVYLGIPLLRLIVNRWSEVSPKDEVICSTCHRDDFDIEEFKAIDREFIKLICRNCGHTMTISGK